MRIGYPQRCAEGALDELAAMMREETGVEIMAGGGAGAAYLVTDPERVRAVVRAAHT